MSRSDAARAHPGEMIGLTVFDAEASYRKNAEHLEQGAWYREPRAAPVDVVAYGK